MKISKLRAITIYSMVSILFSGLGLFIYKLVINSSDWALSPINKHLSENFMDGGKILDTNNVILAQTVNGKRVYNEKESIRKAMLHIVGDGSILIPTSIQSRYVSELFGYNLITGFGLQKEFSNNRDIKLTLDSNICSIASKCFEGKKGTALVYNYLSGEIICMVSSPTYDPNNRPDLTKDKNGKFEGVYINRAISSSFTPGSIVKVITSAAAIDNIENIDKKFFKCNKVKVIDGENVTCMSNHGKINLKNALAVSCDIVFSDIAIELGKEKMLQVFESFGFNHQYSIDGINICPSTYELQNASKADLGWSAIGQYKDLVNPIHMLIIMGAIANDGTPILPHIIKSTSSNFTITNLNNLDNKMKSMISKSTANKLKSMMRYTMEHHYGDSMFQMMKMCVKTGTAEVGEKEPHGWIVGFSQEKKFPFAFVVMVENGGFGIKSAGPIASKIMKEVYQKVTNNKYV